MECECKREGVKSHDVIRDYIVAGNYNRCGGCDRVEWNWLTDELEMEINDSLYHYFVKPLRFAQHPSMEKPKKKRVTLGLLSHAI